MFRPHKAIIRQHIYEFYPTAHYSNIFFTYVFVIFFLYFILQCGHFSVMYNMYLINWQFFLMFGYFLRI
jgi:hypothetical protein